MIADALSALRPGAQWSMTGDTLDGLLWHDQGSQPPTQEEVSAWIAANSLARRKAALIKRVEDDGPTLWACAQLVIAKAEAWADLSYSIERARIVGKKTISDASDAAAAQAAYEAITWPT